MLFGLLHQFGRDAVEIFERLVLAEVAEAFLLHARDIQHIGGADDIGDIVGFAHLLPAVLDLVHVIERQAQCFGRYEGEAHIMPAEQLRQRMHGTTVAQVADHRDVQAVERAKFLP